VLITRPTKKAQALSASLAEQNIACVNQPLFDYQPLADKKTSASLLVDPNIIIFVSAAAVEFAHATFPAHHWRYQHVVAVGKATKTALQQLGINNVICPSQENSEGLLSLPLFSKGLSDKSITIVRGNGGRELLAQHLKASGAAVHYLESYQRIWRTFTKDISNQWFGQQINCIVVTSNAILEKLVQMTLENLAPSNTQQLTNYWHNQCVWVVASQRISDKAKQFGLTHIVISDGASEQAITTTLQQLKNQ
jgi:uroporphyrinogen-III synthase